MDLTAVPFASGGGCPGGHLDELRQAPLELLSRAAAESDGGFIRLAWGTGLVLMLHDPTAIERVMVDRDHVFVKPKLDLWKRVVGETVLTSEGKAWARSRHRSVRITGPRFVSRAGQIVTEATSARLARWPDDGTVDLLAEMRAITLTAALRELCGTDETFQADTFAAHLTTVMEYIHARESNAPGTSLGEAAAQRFADSADFLRENVQALVDHHSGAQDNFLGILIAHQDRDSGASLTPNEIVDELLGHLIAGHESTATSLAWALLLLSHHPEVMAQVRDEIAGATRNGKTDPADLVSLPLLSGVFAEALRLYPPAWILMRATAKPCELAGVGLPAGTLLLASQYSVQRMPHSFPDPDDYQPERWIDTGAGESKGSYFPFGGGRRLCPGRQLALTTARVVLALVIGGFRLEPVGGWPEPTVDVTLRPPAGTLMRVTRRESINSGDR